MFRLEVASLPFWQTPVSFVVFDDIYRKYFPLPEEMAEELFKCIRSDKVPVFIKACSSIVLAMDFLEKDGKHVDTAFMFLDAAMAFYQCETDEETRKLPIQMSLLKQGNFVFEEKENMEAITSKAIELKMRVTLPKDYYTQEMEAHAAEF